MATVFVFGSNLAGRHGKGAALTARNDYGAEYGVGKGRTGNAYALPTKDENLRTLPMWAVDRHVSEFVAYAAQNQSDTFLLTPVGTGLAGHDKPAHTEHAPLSGIDRRQKTRSVRLCAACRSG